MEAYEPNTASPDWASLTAPLLGAILQAALSASPLPLPACLKPGSDKDAARRAVAAIAAFRCTCSGWRAAADTALPRLTWAVEVQHLPRDADGEPQTAAAASLARRLEQLAVAALDLRRLTWSEACGSGLAESLLAALQHQSRLTLRCALGELEGAAMQQPAGMAAGRALCLQRSHP